MTISRTFLRHALILMVAFSAVNHLPVAHADSLQDASALLKQGQAKQALEQVDKYLAANPKDASGRFLRGVTLTELNRSDEAIAIFTKLTEDYPSLPEPYNNLAVIYAQQKQYDKAKTALEAAIRTHPSYATAHENLGDIYARMASQAYDKALQLDSSNKTAQTKLSMIRDLMTVTTRTPTPVIAPVIVATAKPAEPTKAISPNSPVAPPPAVAVTAPPAKPAVVIAAAKPVPKPAEPVAAEPVKPAATVIPIAPTVADKVSDDVARTLASWAEAWSRKDAKAYLSHYASDFKVPGGQTRSVWAAERTKRVSKPGKINVSIEGAKVSHEATPEGDQVVVKFRQHYKSAGLASSANKTLLMKQQNGKWKIAQERIGG